MKFNEMQSEARIQFARNVVMIAEQFGKKMTMDDAVSWLSEHGVFEQREEDIKLTRDSLDQLSEYIKALD